MNVMMDYITMILIQINVVIHPFLNYSNQSITFLQCVDEIKSLYSCCQIKGADNARQIQTVIGFPSTTNQKKHQSQPHLKQRHYSR